MKYLSVCSGIEAATAAWHALDWTPVAFAETEAFPRAVLAHHYPQVPNWGDMNAWRKWPDAAFDVLIGGTPCQSFSVAGLRSGMADPRGNLALVYLAIADRYRPEWLVWENVPGVLSSNGGRDFAAFIGGLEQLGYHAAWRVLDAQYVRVDGFARAVPQRRRRVFVVGCLGDWRRAAAVLFERESLQGHPAPRRQSRERIAPTISARPTGGGGLRRDFDCDGGLIAADLRNGTQDDVAMSLQSCGDVNPNKIPHLITAPAVANPLTHRMHKGVNTTMDEGQTMVAHSLKAEGFDVSEDGTGRSTLLVAQSYSIMPMNSGKDYKARPVDVAQPVMAGGPVGGNQGGDYVVQPLAFSCKDHGADAGDTSPTVRAMGHDGSHANGGGQVAIAFDARQSDVIQYGDRTGPLDTDGSSIAVAFCENIRGEVLETEVTRALASGGGKPGQGYAAVRQGWAVRRLTPLECERLQGFSDGYTAVPYRGKPAADGPRYKALGNSMAVNCMRWLGRRIEMVDAL